MATLCHFLPSAWPEGANVIYDVKWWLASMAVIGCSKQHLLLPPAWSLDVEMIFYFIAPFIIIFAEKLRRFHQNASGALFAMASFSCLLIYYYFHIKTGKYLCFFFIGCSAFQFKWAPTRALARTSLMLFCFALLSVLLHPDLQSKIWQPTTLNREEPSFAWISVIFALLFVPFTIHSVHQKSTSLDRKFGDLAYTFYLSHWVAITFFAGLFKTGPNLGVKYITFTIFALFLYHFLEEPIERWRRRFVKSRHNPPYPSADQQTEKAALSQ